MPEPEVELYDDQQYQISSEASTRRLAAARARARNLRRLTLVGLLLLALIVPIVVAGAVVAARAPGSPFLIVTWPKPKVRQVFGAPTKPCWRAVANRSMSPSPARSAGT